MRAALLLFGILAFFQSKGQDMTAQQIIDACVKVHGGDDYKNAHFAYDFRKNNYEYHYDNGVFKYVRKPKDGTTVDVLTNDGFSRTDNGKKVDLSEKKARSYSNSVNSVNYFLFLPYFLNDGAVNKRLLGEVEIKGQNYYKIEVTFDEEGGGDDHDDIHMYWIHTENFTMDYLGYSYIVNGGGVRFRAHKNRRKIGGIVFQDYINYKHDKTTPVEDMDRLFNEDQLVQLSLIETENIVKL